MNINCIKISWHLLAIAILTVATAIPVWSAPACKTVAKITPTRQNVDAGQMISGVFTPTQIKLDGTKSQDVDVDANLGYQWEQIDGPTVTLNNPNAPTLMITAPEVSPAGATLTFRLTVKGCSNPVQTDSTTTIVNVAYIEHNQPPLASATVDPVEVHEGNIVILDGSPSTDPDGDVLTYQWVQLLNPDDIEVTLQSDPTRATATFTAPDVYPNDGVSLTFILTVSDGYLSSSTQTTVTVIWVNDPPTAQVICPTVIDEYQQITLDGRPSSDPDDGITIHTWTQTQGLPNADLSQVNLSASVISFTAPPLASTFNTMAFSLTVTDAGGLSDSAACSVIVKDVTPPTIYGATDQTAEATSAEGAIVDFTVTATDRADGEREVECDFPSGHQFALGNTPVTCSASDVAGNTTTASFQVRVVDTTPPETNNITGVPNHLTNQPVATFSFDGSDLVTAPGNLTFECQLDNNPFSLCTSPITYSDQSEGEHILKVRAVDGAGNADPTPADFTWQVDLTPPTIALTSEPAEGNDYYFGSVPAAPTCTVTDALSGPDPKGCTITGYGTTVGSHTIIATADDIAGNHSVNTRTYTVLAWTLHGFYPPVDMDGVWNTVKGGSTVPLKFRVFAGPTALTDVAVVDQFTAKSVICPGASATTADVEFTTTGGTVLRYDATAGQFIQNWQTPKNPNACYEVTMQTDDGSLLIARFKLK